MEGREIWEFERRGDIIIELREPESCSELSIIF